MDDIFSMFGDIFGGRGRGGHQTQRYRGTDLRLKVRLSLQEVSTGVTKKFKVRKDVTCDHCHGSGAEAGSGSETCPNCHGTGVEIRTQQSIFGMMQTQTVCHVCGGEGTVIKNKCSHCHGEGIVKGEEVVEINIPAGVAEGMVVNVPGKGNAGRHNGVTGDIQVYIEEEPDDTFIRDGQNVIYNLLLDFPTAALGGQADIPTIDGSSVKIKIEPGTPRRAAERRLAGTPWRLNAEVPGSYLRGPDGGLSAPLSRRLMTALERGDLSLRGVDRVLRLAWTLADLEGADTLALTHIGTALALRTSGVRP